MDRYKQDETELVQKKEEIKKKLDEINEEINKLSENYSQYQIALIKIESKLEYINYRRIQDGEASEETCVEP